MAEEQQRRGNAGARALGWWIGGLTILGTAALVVSAVMGPAPQKAQAVVEKPRRVCPPVISIPARAIGYPVDDILGIRPGMNAHDVEETVKCMSEDYRIETKSIPNGEAGAGPRTRPLLQVDRGPDTLSFALFGAAGAEQVAGLWREAYFDAGVGPPLSSIEGALMQQYGAPHDARDSPDGGRILMWTFAPGGAPLRIKPRDGDIPGMMSYVANGWNVAACIRNVKTDPLAAPAWDGRCGLTIRAEIDPNLADKSHTARWRVAILDQSVLRRQGEQFRALGAATPP